MGQSVCLQRERLSIVGNDHRHTHRSQEYETMTNGERWGWGRLQDFSGLGWSGWRRWGLFELL